MKKRWKEDSAQQLTELIGVLEGIDDFSLESQEQIVHQWIEQKEYKLGNIMNAWLPDTGRRGQGTGYVRYLCITWVRKRPFSE